jgi:very-short-patch-repair endonuclease
MRSHCSFPRGNRQGSLQPRLRSGLTGSNLSCVAPRPVIPELIAVSRRLPDAVFSGCTAGWLHGLDLSPVDPVQVTVANAHTSNRAGVYLRRSRLAPNEIVRLRGLPATSAFRTTVDLGGNRVLVDAVIALDMALHKRIVDLADLRAFCEANRGAKRIAKLRRAIELTEPATESPMETRLRMLLVMARLPRPRAQVPLHDPLGRFLGRPDLYYSRYKLGLEYDGGTHRDSLVEDNHRQNRLLNGGVRLLRFTAGDIFQAPDSVIEQVRLAISQRWS